MHATFYPGRPTWWAAYDSCRVLTVLIPLVFLNFSNLVIHQQLGPALSVASQSSNSASIPSSSFFCSCPDCTVGVTFHDEHIYCNEPGVLVVVAVRLANASMALGCPEFWSRPCSNLIFRLSPLIVLVRCIGRPSPRWILGFQITGKLAR